MDQGQSSRRRALITILILVVVVGVLLGLSDLNEIGRAIQRADLRPLAWAVLFTALSYLSISYSFAVLARALGIDMKRRELAVIFFVTTVLNHLVTTGGVAGLSLRYLAMAKRGVSMRATVTVSILHYYLTSLDMLVMLPVGAAYLLFNARMSRTVMILVGLLTVVLGLVAVISTLLIFVARLRRRLLGLGGRLARAILHRDFSAALDRFELSLEEGVQAMARQPLSIALVFLLTILDWIGSVVVLGFCFDAFGPPAGAGQLITGFVLGIMAGVASLVPGGFGVQEGSMAGVLALLGAPLAQATLAALVFRAVFFLLPYFASLPLYWRLLRQTGARPELADDKGALW